MTLKTIYLLFTEMISTHTLTWSVTSADFCYLLYLDYFNSHAHVERDEVQMSFTEMQVISTHTLTWSVTAADMKNAGIKRISTHTLTWSVTLLH